MRKYKNWTDEEEFYLENSVGRMRIELIAENLGRTESAIRQRMCKLKLNFHNNTIDYVLFHFSKMTGIDNGTLKYWIKNNDLPVKKKYLSEKSYALVLNLEDWWKWAEQNKKLIDFNKYNFWTLGDIPDWVEAQKEVDKLNISKKNKNKKFWTNEDIRTLKMMCKQYRYTTKDIATRLSRTESSINMQIYRLGIKEWPLKEDVNPWTQAERERVKDLYIKGHGLGGIAQKLGRSQQSVRREYARIKEETKWEKYGQAKG